ncbi:MAG: S1C family serine protease [Lachnospiraceae bacterium]|nr:S1C family serine protease [Lachnospiraceae bacterium]
MENRKKDDYKFIKEVIKKKPVDKKAVLIKLGCTVGSAVLFGLVAAFVFVQFLPIIEEKNQKPAQIEFEDDDPQEIPGATPETTVSPAPDNSTGSQSDGSADKTEEFGVAQYKDVYVEMNDIAQDAMKSMVTVTGITSSEDWFNITTESTKQSSGLIVANNGQELFILTEYRAVDTVDRVMVTFFDNTIVDGRYQKHDTNTGLTVVKVDLEDMEEDTLKNMTVAALGNSYITRQGEPVIAIGSPMGYSNSVANGQVTSVTNKITSTDVEYNLLTTNILGSSLGSGALITLDGEVIGIISQQFASSDKGVITGLPISQLKSMIEILSNNGEIPYLGIQGQTVTAEIAKQTGMPRGVYVSVVNMDSPAIQAGIQNADILIRFNGEDIDNMNKYQEKLRKTQVGEEVTLTVMRKGAEGYVEFEFAVVIGNQ